MATYTITVVKLPVSGGGLVKIGSSFESGIVQEEGTTVNALASPTSGYSFVNWMIDDVVVSTSRPYSFVMPPNDITLTATFAVVVVPPEEQQASVYDTSCPKFYFVANMTDRYFTGDVIDLSSYDYLELDDEPVNFDSGKFRLERDSTYHGFNYEFAVDDLAYELGELGYDYIKNKIYSEGTDADVKFVYGFGTTTSLSIFYLGKIDFNEYKESNNGDLVNFSLREIDFDNLLQTAFEEPQEVILSTEVEMYSKVIPKRVQYKVETPETEVIFTFTQEAFYNELFYVGGSQQINKSMPNGYLYINDVREGDSDFDTFITYDFQLDAGDPTDQLKYVIKAKEAGIYSIDIKFWMGMFFVVPANFSDLSFITLKFVHTESNGVTILNSDSYAIDEVLVLTGLLDPNKIAVFDRIVNYELAFDDCLYIYIEINTASAAFPASGAISSIVYYPFNYDYSVPMLAIIGQTLADSSTSYTASSFDVLNTTLKKASEVDREILKSDFFSTGCGELLYLTNGFNIRGSNYSLKVSPKKVMDMLSDIFCLGWGVEYDEFKNELVRIEPVEYFYQDVEIIELTNISDYTKEIDNSKYYNEVEIGFSKYSKNRETDKGFTLDDFHTKHNYSTPIKTNKNKLSVISDLILSAYEIEILRRKQFDKGSSKADSNYSEDDSVFGIQLSSTTPSLTFTYPNASVNQEDPIVFINGNFEFTLTVGEVVEYTSRAGVLQTRTVTGFSSESYIILGEVVYFTTISFSEALVGAVDGVGDLTIVKAEGEGLYLIPESSLAFSTIENLYSPANTFNLRYSPKRMLYNWAKLINGGLFTKGDLEEIVFKQGDGNILLTTQFDVVETCNLGDANKDLIIEGANVALIDFDNRNYLFLPFKISFTASFSFEQLTLLKSCLRGQDLTRNYGYITITNPCGTLEKVYVMSAEYSGIEDEVKIEGYLKNIV